MKVDISTIEKTKKFAHALAQVTDKVDILCLKGDLGAGKTTFTKFFVNCFFKEEIEVQSPTFNIVFPYEFDESSIHHFDLYRIKSVDELEEIGFFDALESSISIIEWPEISEDYLPSDRLEVRLHNKNERVAEIICFGNWNDKIAKLNVEKI